MDIQLCQKLTTASGQTIVLRTRWPHLTKSAVTTSTFETIFVPILINLWNRKTTILIDPWEKKTIEEKIFLKFTLTAKRKNWEWIFFEQPAHSRTPAGASGDLGGEFHNIWTKTLKVGENWRNRTHLVTSVIILPEFGEHWGHGGRLPFYRGRAREDEPVRNISNKFTGIS